MTILSEPSWAQKSSAESTTSVSLPGTILSSPPAKPVQPVPSTPSVSIPLVEPPNGAFADSLPRCSDFAEKLDPGAPKPQAKVPEVMTPTMYDDGFACPGGCTESHVVFDPKHNKTSRAHAPGSAPDFKPCLKGKKCQICFKDNDPSECMILKFEGTGPPFGRFDFPVVFFQKNCKGDQYANLPSPLKKQCDYLEKQKPRYANRVNCIAEPTDESCRVIMTNAKEAKKVDSAAYQECKQKGEAAFNAAQPSIDTKRTHDCAYSLKKYSFKSSAKKDFACRPEPGKPCERVNCKKTWSLLMPGSCPQGSYVGKYSLNCCSGDLFWQIALGNDCEKYFPKRPSTELATPGTKARQ